MGQSRLWLRIQRYLRVLADRVREHDDGIDAEKPRREIVAEIHRELGRILDDFRGGDQETTPEEKGLLAEAIEYHESMIPDLEPDGDQTQFEEEWIYHENRIKWLKELLTLRGRVTRQDETIAGYEEAKHQHPNEKPLKRLYKRERALHEHQSLPPGSRRLFFHDDEFKQLHRDDELLKSTQAQCRRLQEENQKLRDEKAALADVIADLRMDLKARE